MLEIAGLRINLGKSAAIIKIVGRKRTACEKSYVMRRSHGLLKCSSRDGRTYHVPIVQRWDYLGATLSYKSHDADTVAKRVKAAVAAFAKLKTVLGESPSLAVAPCTRTRHASVVR